MSLRSTTNVIILELNGHGVGVHANLCWERGKAIKQKCKLSNMQTLINIDIDMAQNTVVKVSIEL